LDEWTQRQIDAMRLGGNANAATYFRKHGISDMNQKIEKKYTSKAAISYRTVLAKLVDNEAIQRGEDSATSSTGGTSNSDDTMSGKSLLESLNMMDDEEMKQKMLSATRPSSTVGVAVAKAVPVSQLPGAKGRLMTPPSSGNAPTLTQIRKPASSSSSTSSGNALNLLKKKPSGSSKAVALKMGSNKLSNNNMTNGTATADDHIEDIETSFKNMAEEEKSAAEVAAAAVVEAPVVAAAVTTVPTQTTTAIPNGTHTTTHTGPAHLSPVNNAPKQSLADSIAKMKAQNGDFFGGL
jgi:hypothetical protein